MTRTAVGSCHPRPGRGARTDEYGGGNRRNRRLVLGANKLAGGARHPPTSHLVLLFATLLTLASGRVQCGWRGYGRGRVRVPAGWRGRGRGHIREGVCNRVCLPWGL
jgi:hypothetical protein